MTSPLVLGQLDATVRDDWPGLRLECDHCRQSVTGIQPGMSLDDLVMAYRLHQHAA